jgi:hypothetical protein
MCKVKEILKYIYRENNIDKDKFGLGQVVRIIYLADWKFSIDHEKTITKIEWKFVSGEPKMDETSLNEVLKFFDDTDRITGFFKNLYTEIAKSKLDAKERRTVKFAMDTVRTKSPDELSKLIYSTFPSLSLVDSDKVDLPSLAKFYVEKVRDPQGHKREGISKGHSS